MWQIIVPLCGHVDGVQMTKTVRIENGCTSKCKLIVTVQDNVLEKDEFDNWKETGEWRDVKSFDLNFPTAMLSEYVTSTRRFIVQENGAYTE